MWTQERKGALSRELLFDPLGSTERRALSVTRLLQLHMGMFMFLCEVRPQPDRPLPLLVFKELHVLKQLHLFSLSFFRNVLTVSLESSASEAKRI